MNEQGSNSSYSKKQDMKIHRRVAITKFNLEKLAAEMVLKYQSSSRLRIRKALHDYECYSRGIQAPRRNAMVLRTGKNGEKIGECDFASW